MPKLKRPDRDGQIVYNPMIDEWYVVTDAVTNPVYPVGLCVLSSKEGRAGRSYGLTSGVTVFPSRNVPDRVWAALAALRLTQ